MDSALNLLALLTLGVAIMVLIRWASQFFIRIQVVVIISRKRTLAEVMREVEELGE